jgi:hypothetical protein
VVKSSMHDSKQWLTRPENICKSCVSLPVESNSSTLLCRRNLVKHQEIDLGPLEIHIEVLTILQPRVPVQSKQESDLRLSRTNS